MTNHAIAYVENGDSESATGGRSIDSRPKIPLSSIRQGEALIDFRVELGCGAGCDDTNNVA
jgi:hypothetical protein